MKKIIIVLGILLLPLHYVSAYTMSSLEVQYRNKLSEIDGQIAEVQQELNQKQAAYEGSGITKAKWAAIAQPYYDTINSLTNSYNWYVNEINKLMRLSQDCEYKNAYYDSDLGQCICKNGYKADTFGNSCILDIKTCSDVYGAFSIDAGNNQCGCMHGYVWNDAMTNCIKLTKDVGDKQCSKEYGSNTEAASDDYTKCICKKGYERNSIKTKCVKSDVVTATKTNTSDNSGNLPPSYTRKSDELKDAIQWMYDNGLTMYNTLPDFLPYDEITREQASKFFVEFAAKVLGKDRGNIYSYDIFSDISKADPTLKDHIIYANNMGLFKGSNGKFMPFNNLTKAQAIAVVIRMVDGYLDESGTTPYDLNKGTGYAWYSEYVSRANYSYNLNEWKTYDNFDMLDSQNITRGDVAILLYDMYLLRQNNCFMSEIKTVNGEYYCERLGSGSWIAPWF